MDTMINSLLNRFERNAKSIIRVLFIILLLSGVIYSLYLGDILRYHDEHDYLRIANNLFETHQYSLDGKILTAYRSPGYPLILYFTLWFTTYIPFFRLLNYLALIYSIYILYILIRKYSTPLAGFFGVILCCFYPIFFYTAGTLLPQIIGSALLLTILYLITNDNAKNCHYIGGGILYGYLILTVPGFLLNLPVFAFFPWILKKDRKLRSLMLFLAASLFLVAGWTLRNYLVFNRLVPLTTHSGLTFLVGNHEKARPNSYIDVLQYIGEHYSHETMNFDEVALNHYYFNKAFYWISNNKYDAAKLYFLKVINYFNYKVELATASEASRTKNLIMIFTYFPILSLFLIRLLLIRQYRPTRFELFLIIIYLTNAPLMAIFLIRLRLRLPYDFLLIAVVAIFLGRLCRNHLPRSG